MMKFKSIQEYLESNSPMCNTREDMKDIILQSALELLGDCAHNFDGDARVTERVAQPLIYLNEILDNVE